MPSKVYDCLVLKGFEFLGSEPLVSKSDLSQFFRAFKFEHFSFFLVDSQ